MLRLLLVFMFMFVGCLSHAEICDLNSFRQKFCISNIPQHLGLDELKHLNCEPIENFPATHFQLTQSFLIAPRWLQLRLCSLGKVIVHPTFKGENAQSWSYPPDANVVGIDKTFIEEKSSLARYSRSDIVTAMFGKTLASGETVPNAFGLDMNRPDIPGLAVMFTVAHEIGHILYRTRNAPLRQKLFGDCLEKSCPNFAAGTWGSIDWLNGISPSGKDDQIYRGAIQPRSSAIRGFIVPTATPRVVHMAQLDRFYQVLNSSSFVTNFALASPEEDFCETYGMLAVIPIVQSWNFRYLSGQSEDIFRKMANSANPYLRFKFQFARYADSLIPYN